MTDYSSRFGIGQGDAQVFSSGNIVGAYAQQLKNQDIQRQKEREAYAKDLEKISWDGARDADEGYFRKNYEAILDLNHKREFTDKKEEKIALTSEIERRKKNLLFDAKKSADEKKVDLELASQPLKIDGDLLADGYADILKARNATSTFSKDFQTYGQDKFAPKSKPYDLNKSINDIANIVAKQVNEPFVIGSGIDAKRAYREGKLLDEGAFKTMFLQQLVTNPAAKRAALQGLEPTEENLKTVTDAAYQTIKDKYALKIREGGYVSPSERELLLATSRARINKQFSSDKSEKPPILRQDWINDMLDGTPGSGEILAQAMEASGKYGAGKIKLIKRSGDVFDIIIPESKGDDLTPAYSVRIDKRDRKGSAVKLNTLIEKITGEKVNLSTLLSEGGTKKVVGGKGVKEFERKPERPTEKSYAPSIEKGIEAVMKRNGITRDQAIQALRAAKKI